MLPLQSPVSDSARNCSVSLVPLPIVADSLIFPGPAVTDCLKIKAAMEHVEPRDRAALQAAIDEFYKIDGRGFMKRLWINIIKIALV